MTYEYNDVYKSTLDYFGGDELAAQVWINKYCLKDSDGNLYELNPSDMHRRLAKEISRIENKYPNPLTEEEIFNLLDHFKYIVPAGGSMTGIGNPYQVSSLSNCFVVGSSTGNSDSYGGILNADQELIQLMKRRGGVGHDLSYIRPNGSPVKNAALTSTGVVPFMERFSNSTREVAQDGRRGALMLSIDIKHPDSEAFIDAKMTEGKVTGANVSVKISDDFMKAVENNTTFIQQYPINSDKPKYIKEVNARELWNKIVHNAWKSAEPGIMFWDNIINEAIPDCYGDDWKTISTNPCGEVPLCDADSCRLLALNLYSFVDKPFTKESKLNLEKFKEVSQKALRIMDDIIDLEIEKINKILEKIDNDPEPNNIKRVERELWERISNKCQAGRRTGVGITAEADMLAALGLTYGDKYTTNFVEKLHAVMAKNVYYSSYILGQERGCFKIFDGDKEKNNRFIKRLKEKYYDETDEYNFDVMKGRRNIACLSIAPTGSLSIMTQTSSGLEPVFKLVYKRRRKINPNDTNTRVDYTDKSGDKFQEYLVFHPKFKEWMRINGYDRDDYTDDEMNEIISKSPYYKACAEDINWIEKVHMQGKVQQWVDHSISITHNLPSDVPEEVVNNLYMEAWKSGCKGVTVYRDGSRSGVLIDKNEKQKTDSKIVEARPKRLKCDVIRFTNKGEKWVAFVGLLDDEPYEIFTGVLDEDEGIFLPKSIEEGEIVKVIEEDGNKHYDFHYCNKNGYKMIIEAIGHKFNKEYWNYARLISGILRYKMPIANVIRLIDSLDVDNESINTWKNGVKRALKKYIKDGTKAAGDVCPNCKQELVYQEGCLVCKHCGYSRCG